MLTPNLPDNEAERLATLKQLALLDTPAEEAFDDFTFLASNICGTPIAIITLLDETRQWFKSKVGLDAQETPREISFCGHAILQDDIFEVTDALSDERFLGNPLVTGEPKIRFYAGIPIKSKEGFKLGTLCVIDQQPRKLNSKQREALKCLSRQVTTQIEQRATQTIISNLNAELTNKFKFIENVTNSVPAIIGYWNTNLECEFANRNYQTYLDINPSTLIGKHYYDVFPKEFLEQARPKLANVLKGESQTFEVSKEWPILGLRHGLVNYTPEFDGNGQVKGFFSVTFDITLTKRTEFKLKLSDKALQSAHEAIFITDENHRLIYVNEGFTLISGYSQNEAIGEKASLLKSNEHDEQICASMNQQIKAFGYWQGEVKSRHKNGCVFTALMTIDSILDDQGKVTNYVASFIDITESNKTKSELALTASMLERTGKIANVGGWEYDFKNQTVRWSEQVYLIHEIDHCESLSIELAMSFFTEEARIKLQSAVEECIELGRPWDLELPFVTAKGKHLWVRTMGEMIINKGKKSKVAGIFQDITSQKLQEQLALSKEIELRETIIREVHHHIKNNIQGLSGILYNMTHQHPALTAPINDAISHLQSVAIIHGLQGKSLGAAIELGELTHAISQNIQNIWQTKILVQSSDHWTPCYLSKKEAVPIALILNELMTNAEKHNSSAAPVSIEISQTLINKSHIEVSICVKNDGHFTFTDDIHQDTAHFGLKLIHALMPKVGAYLYLSARDNTTQAKLALKYPVITIG